MAEIKVNPADITVGDMVLRITSRLTRADIESSDSTLPKDQRTFHAGRREAYLTCLADILGREVKDIRRFVESSRG